MKNRTRNALALATAAALGLAAATAFSHPGDAEGPRGWGGWSERGPMGGMMGGPAQGMMGGMMGHMMGGHMMGGMEGPQDMGPGHPFGGPGKGPCPGAGGMPGMGSDAEAMQAQVAQAAEARLDRLRAQLGIRPDQEAAWNAYADAVKALQTFRAEAPRGAGRALEAEGRLRLRATRMRQLADRLEALATAREALYEKLDPPQRVAFDAATRHRG
ncbi:Spy/CpxP family protein refolding chaperone [Inmirania thermothiophila]|uniref:LTXXQ motif family protein n=1 Tax=Inmirania thermothiophila TaxID=1750597 RepID=A0A3N1XSA4_9GAMM|nr:Spy/CpxP family protein refolding chaperone [Inmirania thermothiophila]ROR29515.1 LTXXQ motif family protein [Inmirania thermothiophila]